MFDLVEVLKDIKTNIKHDSSNLYSTYPSLEDDRKVDRYDGQTLFVKNTPVYELGNFLGGGSAGMVYEAENLKTKEVRGQLCCLSPLHLL
jgi:hypothetical protein